MLLNSFGEVADFVYPVNQFFNGTRSQDACGPYCSGYIKYMGKPGSGATGTSNDIDVWAFQMYTNYIGQDIASNHNGTDIPQLYAMLADAGAAFYKLDKTVSAIKASLALGRPVVVAAAETGMHDVDNGNKVDYSWVPAGNHIIVISGVRADGALLVRDPANIGATGQRGSGDAKTHAGPVAYAAGSFGPIVSATSIVPSWEKTVSSVIDIPALIAALQPLMPPSQLIVETMRILKAQ